ncbi:MAG: histidinol-phosphatase HisJ family protein [Oscillospiraceae bacterium]|nr:histidinol-phosphatase HisJ family protein [Oscillospiraceae bacterium]
MENLFCTHADILGETALFDTHTHSTVSDGGNTPEQMLDGAAFKGLKVFALTDHFDIHDRFPEPCSRFDGAGRESSYQQLTALKESHEAKGDTGIKFLKGIEIGQAHHYTEVAENWLNSHNYDFVLASCHIIRSIEKTDFYSMDYSKNAPDLMLKQYFTELIELCSWGASNENKYFDSLSHLTYPLRYMSGKGDINKHTHVIDELFAIMVEHDIALEINTGGGAVMCPEFPQIKRYYELGGRLITIGSDSHNVSSIGGGIGKGIEMAKSAGFSECVYYEKRRPRFIRF